MFASALGLPRRREAHFNEPSIIHEPRVDKGLLVDASPSWATAR